MANLEEVIYGYLTADTSFSSNFTGIYWLEADAQVEPYLVFWLVDDNGNKAIIGTEEQGEARIQFSLWDDNKFRGADLRKTMRQKVEGLNETRDGYTLTCQGINEQSLQRLSESDPYHFVVDGIIQWRS